MADFTLEPFPKKQKNETPAKKPYAGIDKRVEERRQNGDRREQMRFTLGNVDRRKNQGRREGELNATKKLYKPKNKNF